MTNVQEALNNALFTIRCYRTEITLDKKRPNDLIEVDLVISEIEAALADIEKCEPVAEVEPIGYMSNLAIQRLSQRGLGTITLHKTKTCFNPVYYTSPQPREWVGLDAHQITEIRQSMLTDGCLDTVEFADAITAKLKQINTKD